MQFGASAALFDAAYKHQMAGRLADAEVAVRQALAIDPRHVDSLHLLGVLAGQAGQHQASLELIDQALALSPGFSSAHANRGVALMAMGRNDEGLVSLRRAVELEPGHLHGLYALGNALAVRGDWDGAVDKYRQVLDASPDHFDARHNLAQALQRQGKLDEAVDSFRMALVAQPNAPQVHYNMAVALQLSGQAEDAVCEYRRAIQLAPNYWLAHSSLLLAMSYVPGSSGEQLAQEHHAFDVRHTRQFAPPAPVFANTREPERRLRIGYVSGNFHNHPVGSYLSGPLAAHDKTRVEVFCYANEASEDEVTAKFKAAADHWRPIFHLSDAQAAALVRQDRIDILVDLSGHTEKNRPLLFAQKPAPVQASWLGYPGTTGLSAMDYLVMDAWTLPPGSESWATEAVARLPHGRLSYTPPAYAPDVAVRPEDGPVTFGSFNNLAKIGPDVVRLWARVLDAVPGSRLVLKWKELDQPNIRKRVANDFAVAGVREDRLELRAGAPHARMLGEYGDIDIALDPFPFTGGLTSCEALWMGVPVVTLPQGRIASRQTLAFLSAVGLDDLAASSQEDYVRIAAALAADPARRAELRAALRGRMRSAPANDAKGFTAGLETAYRQMWRRWTEGQAPATIDIV